MATVSGDLAAILPASDERLVEHSAVRHDAIDEAVVGGVGGGHHLAEQQHLHGALAADVARQGDHRRRAEEADVDAGRAELGGVGGDGEIAGGDELAAGGGGGALHGGDHRLGAGDDRLHHRGAARHRLGVEGEALVGVGAVRGELFQVVAGAEHGTVGGEHDGRDGAVGGEPREARVQPVDHVERQAVARIRPVQVTSATPACGRSTRSSGSEPILALAATTVRSCISCSRLLASPAATVLARLLQRLFDLGSMRFDELDVLQVLEARRRC